MKMATYLLCFPDMDYESLARACGLACAKRVIQGRGVYLPVIGLQTDIDIFSANLSYGPEE